MYGSISLLLGIYFPNLLQNVDRYQVRDSHFLSLIFMFTFEFFNEAVILKGYTIDIIF